MAYKQTTHFAMLVSTTLLFTLLESRVGATE